MYYGGSDGSEDGGEVMETKLYKDGSQSYARIPVILPEREESFPPDDGETKYPKYYKIPPIPPIKPPPTPKSSKHCLKNLGKKKKKKLFIYILASILILISFSGIIALIITFLFRTSPTTPPTTPSAILSTSIESSTVEFERCLNWTKSLPLGNISNGQPGYLINLAERKCLHSEGSEIRLKECDRSNRGESSGDQLWVLYNNGSLQHNGTNKCMIAFKWVGIEVKLQSCSSGSLFRPSFTENPFSFQLRIYETHILNEKISPFCIDLISESSFLGAQKDCGQVLFNYETSPHISQQYWGFIPETKKETLDSINLQEPNYC